MSNFRQAIEEIICEAICDSLPKESYVFCRKQGGCKPLSKATDRIFAEMEKLAEELPMRFVEIPKVTKSEGEKAARTAIDYSQGLIDQHLADQAYIKEQCHE
jgi:hypothetical protein